MLLIDRKPLEESALNDPKDKFHKIAVEYNNTIKYLQERYKNGIIRFKRPNFPRPTKAADAFGNEIPKATEPETPMRIPLKSYQAISDLGKHYVACCLDAPEVLPNGLWELGRQRAITVKGGIAVNVNDNPDLAFFLYKVSPFVKKGILKVLDPLKDDEALGEEEMQVAYRKHAVWTQLSDIEKLKTMASAYGVVQTGTKQPNQIRKELEDILVRNDKLRRSNPIIKGTKEFLEEMKVTDSVLLRAFVQKAIDESKLSCGLNGMWKIGDKAVVQVPATDIRDSDSKIRYLCNFMSLANQTEKLTEFMRDLINREYLEGITNKQEWVWLGKIAGVPTQFKKLEEVQKGVTDFFIPV